MAEFSFEIEEKLLVLSENDKGWTKELNRVSFNGAPAKYDIALGVQTTPRWARELPLDTKNFKFSLTPSKLKQGQHGASLFFF